MKKRSLIFTLALLAAIFMFSSCASHSPFEGMWLLWPDRFSTAASEYHFFQDGTGTVVDRRGFREARVGISSEFKDSVFDEEGFVHTFTWIADDDVLTIHFDNSPSALRYYFEFTDDGIRLALDTWPTGTTMMLWRYHLDMPGLTY